MSEKCPDCGGTYDRIFTTGQMVGRMHGYHFAGRQDCLRRQLAQANGMLQEFQLQNTDMAIQVTNVGLELAQARIEGYTEDTDYGNCQRCHRAYQHPWSASDGLWNAVVGGHAGLYCPSCFDILAREKGLYPHWSCATESECEEDCQQLAQAKAKNEELEAALHSHPDREKLIVQLRELLTQQKESTRHFMSIVERLRNAELGQCGWEDSADIVLLNGKPVGATITHQSREFDRWWASVKEILLGPEAAGPAKEVSDEDPPRD